MLKIGITGNIGGGKTTVSKVFEVLGIPVFYADNAAKKVMITDPVLMASLKEAFGDQAYFNDGTLNRKHIASIVFNDEAQLARLNSLVHPAVFRAFDSWADQITNAPYVIKEAALLFESSSYKMCDYSIMVTAPLELRIKRVMERDGLTRDEVESRNAKQFSEEMKVKLADYVIRNDDTELVIPQVLTLHEQFLSIAAAK
jgi:dephospho-CoA kinase